MRFWYVISPARLSEVQLRRRHSKQEWQRSTLTAKYGLPLKNLDHFPQMKKRRP